MEKESLVSKIKQDKHYTHWLKELKTKIQHVQLKAAVSVNTELLKFYWSLGEEIVIRQENSKWGEGLLKQLSFDLIAEFPEMKGFSKRNLELIRQWYLFYQLYSKVNAVRTELSWMHLRLLLKVDNETSRLWYQSEAIKENWSTRALERQINSFYYERILTSSKKQIIE